VPDNIIYNPINRAGLNCGDSFSEQKVIFGGLNCEGIKIIKGTETKAVLPMGFTIPSAQYVRNELVLPKNGNLTNKITLPTLGYNFMALTVQYTSDIPQTNQIIRYAFTSDLLLNDIKSIGKTMMLSTSTLLPFEDLYVYNPNQFDVVLNYLFSK
jgi:hypothetical protein